MQRKKWLCLSSDLVLTGNIAVVWEVQATAFRLILRSGASFPSECSAFVACSIHSHIGQLGKEAGVVVDNHSSFLAMNNLVLSNPICPSL